MNQSNKFDVSKTEYRKPFIKLYLSDLLRGFKRFWFVCIVLAVICGCFFVVSQKLSYKPTYSTSATLIVSTQNEGASVGGISVYSYYYDSTTAIKLSETFPFILSSNLLQNAICEDLDIEVVPVKISVSSVAGSNMFTMSATGKEPQITYDVLVSAIEKYPSVAKHVVGNIQLKFVTEPQVPSSPSNEVNYVSEFVKGAIIGSLLGLAFILIYVLQRRTIKTKDDINSDLGMELIATLPAVKKTRKRNNDSHSIIYNDDYINNDYRDAVRVFRNMFMSVVGANDKVIMITSSVPGEGKTTVTINLALSLSNYNKKILLIDADVRHPSVINATGFNDTELEFTEETADYKIACINNSNLHILIPNYDIENYSEYFSSKRIKSIFASLRNSFDYILIDTPPCGLISDAMYISQSADAVLYVIYQDIVRVSKIKSALDSLMSTDINIIGCVLNGAETGLSGYGYGYGSYGYGYGTYGYGEGKKNKRKNTFGDRLDSDSSKDSVDNERQVDNEKIQRL